jgi:hypothetical protein
MIHRQQLKRSIFEIQFSFIFQATQNINTNAITNAVNVTVTATGNFVDNWGITSDINGLVEVPINFLKLNK